jgi:hypothetical protein
MPTDIQTETDPNGRGDVTPPPVIEDADKNEQEPKTETPPTQDTSEPDTEAIRKYAWAEVSSDPEFEARIARLGFVRPGNEPKQEQPTGPTLPGLSIPQPSNWEDMTYDEKNIYIAQETTKQVEARTDKKLDELREQFQGTAAPLVVQNLRADVLSKVPEYAKTHAEKLLQGVDASQAQNPNAASMIVKLAIGDAIQAGADPRSMTKTTTNQEPADEGQDVENEIQEAMKKFARSMDPETKKRYEANLRRNYEARSNK